MRARQSCLAMLLTGALTAAGCGSSSSSSSSASSTTAQSKPAAASTTATTGGQGQALGPEAIPLEAGPPLAPASSTTPGSTVDGIQCAPIEQLAYHIHAHLQVYDNGQPRSLPAAIGLLGPVAQQTAYGPFYGAQQCYYWLHTHASDGVIHIESPTKRIYTLGNFFDEWRQPLSRTQAASVKGKVTAFLNGKPWKANPRTIPLLPHASIQLDVGTPDPPAAVISWAESNL
ncbi:MAG: hypothetical protein JO130_07635 [Solirubrobacterales bacterium]|nr:hypothetical protein [Solirubrobacterales bacterium]